MQRLLLLLIPLLLFLATYLFKEKKTEVAILQKDHSTHNIQKIDPHCAPCFEKYVEDVINKGSNIFHYPTSPMPAGTVTPKEAKKIAAFMATLQGFKPSHPEWVKEGKYLFYGNCTGCHSNEGKGKEGYFPDLTRKPLKGVEILGKG